MPGYLGCFLDVLAYQFDHLTLFLHPPNSSEIANFDYTIKSGNIDLIHLPQRRSAPYRMLNVSKFMNPIKERVNSLDGLLLRGPSPLLPGLASATGLCPPILMIVGDNLAAVDSLHQPLWRKELIRLMETINYLQQVNVAKKSLVFVNSRTLFTHYQGKAKKLVETHTTTLTGDSFYLRNDTCQFRPIHLLYTGRMDPAKGLLDIVKALSILVKRGENVVLDLVGWPEAGSNILELINSMSKTFSIEDRIIYHGYKAVGPELFAYYKTADIYILASQSSFEGFPRTIWEAMAHSLPVVATRVGSIPDFIEGFAELTEPRNPEGLVECIEKIIYDHDLRKEYIHSGYNLAKQNTLEIQVGEMARVIKEWITEGK